MNEARKEDIRKIADHYGLDAQMNVTIEELSELTQAIARYRRFAGCDQKQKRVLLACIAEGLADVEIMVEQMTYLTRSDLAVEYEICYKVKRQLKRMEEEEKDASK